MSITGLLSITDLIGRLHPLLVHLPIGILLIAALFYFLSRKEKYQSLNHAATIGLFWGMISAIASCISGFLLSKTDDYDEQLIFKHQWFGIATGIISIIVWYLSKRNQPQLKWMMFPIVLLIIITGHLGGSITHGSDYLAKAFSKGDATIHRKPIPDVQNAIVYTDIIQPLLEARCYNCHGPNKQKGKLRLNTPESILKGGKDGKIIVPGKPEKSDMIERIFLPKDDEDHMPPKEKPQLTKSDIELLHWWVSNNADFNKKVKEFSQVDKIKPLLLALQSGETIEELNSSELPDKPVGKADEKIIQQLRGRGVVVMPVAAGANYLSVNFIAVDSVTENDLKLLQSLKKQLLWLKFSNKRLSADMLSQLNGFSVLTRLYLDRTGITDESLKFIKELRQLQYINLVGDTITAKGLEQLKDLKNLQYIYLYQTGIAAPGFEALKKIFPKAMIDTGGYKVPFLSTDTAELKAPIKK